MQAQGQVQRLTHAEPGGQALAPSQQSSQQFEQISGSAGYELATDGCNQEGQMRRGAGQHRLPAQGTMAAHMEQRGVSMQCTRDGRRGNLYNHHMERELNKARTERILSVIRKISSAGAAVFQADTGNRTKSHSSQASCFFCVIPVSPSHRNQAFSSQVGPASMLSMTTIIS